MPNVVEKGKMRTLVVILAYNEEDSIGAVVDEVQHMVQADILVVDDGSEDDTRKKAIEAGARCISLAFNAGIGVAEQAGFQVAAEEGYDFVIRLDGDGQHDPAKTPLLLEALREDHADLVIGSRYVDGRNGERWSLRFVGNKFMSWLINRLTSYRITDATCGYRGYARRAIEAFACDYPDDFPEVEALMMSALQGFTIKEVPISSLQRESGESVMKADVAVYYMCKVTLAVAISKLRVKWGTGSELTRETLS
jgi:glycosyltransferase involved in cell wall biosynthesis